MADLPTSSACSLVRLAVLATTVVDFATTANTFTWLVGTGQGVNCVGLALDFCAGLFSGLQASAFGNGVVQLEVFGLEEILYCLSIG